MRRAARTHVIFGVDFEESILDAVAQNGCEMFVLETGADPSRSFQRRATGTLVRADRPAMGEIAHRGPRSSHSRSGLDRRERAVVAGRRDDARARAGLHKGPRV